MIKKVTKKKMGYKKAKKLLRLKCLIFNHDLDDGKLQTETNIMSSTDYQYKRTCKCCSWELAVMGEFERDPNMTEKTRKCLLNPEFIGVRIGASRVRDYFKYFLGG